MGARSKFRFPLLSTRGSTLSLSQAQAAWDSPGAVWPGFFIQSSAWASGFTSHDSKKGPQAGMLRHLTRRPIRRASAKCSALETGQARPNRFTTHQPKENYPMFRNRMHTMMLMAALGAMSAGGTAVAAAEPETKPLLPGQVKLVHVDTKQECVFDDQRAVDDFLANVEAPDNWTVAVAHKVVEVDLAALRTQLDADNAAAAAAEATADTAAATETTTAATETAPAADAAPAPAAPKTTRKTAAKA